MIEIAAEGETLGELLQRLREDRDWTQYDVAARVDPDRANDVRAMKNLQTALSRYELNNFKRPDPVLLAKLEMLYDLPGDSLALSALRTVRQLQARKKIEEDSIAIPDEPELREAVNALFLFEPEELPGIASYLRATKRTPETENAEKRRAG